MGSSSKSSLSADWVVSVQNLELMPDPHCEQGSQDAFVIDAAHSLVPLQDITALRSLLNQRSDPVDLSQSFLLLCKSSHLLFNSNSSHNPRLNSRFLLRQPSPNWKTFHLDDMEVRLH